MNDVEKDPPPHRTNGWSWPLHPCQLGVWACILKFCLVYYFVLIPALQAQLQPIACTVSFIGWKLSWLKWSEEHSAESNTYCVVTIKNMYCIIMFFMYQTVFFF